MSHEKIEISDVTRENIVNKLIEPYYMDMIKTTIGGKKLWRTLGISLETSSKLMVALGGIFSFSAGFYHDETLSFVSGSISCMSLALLQIASFSYKENKKQGEELNILLKKLNLDTIPSMVRSEDQTTVISNRYYSPPRSNSFAPTHYPVQSLAYASSPRPVNHGPVNHGPVNHETINDEILQTLEKLKEEEYRLNEIKILQQKEIAEFSDYTLSVRNEIQNLEEAVGKKIIKLSEREERIKEREKELNLENLQNII
jgi:hypothetical protein